MGMGRVIRGGASEVLREGGRFFGFWFLGMLMLGIGCGLFGVFVLGYGLTTFGTFLDLRTADHAFYFYMGRTMS